MYIVLEIQRSGESTLACLNWTFVDRNVAEQKYHQVLAAAAVSEIELHSAVLLSETGYRIKGESYDHRVSPVEPVEEQPEE